MSIRTTLRKAISAATCLGLLASGIPAFAAGTAAPADGAGTAIMDTVKKQAGAPILNRAYTGLQTSTKTSVPAGQKLRLAGVFGYDGFNKNDGNRYIFKATLMEKLKDGTARAVKDKSSKTWDLDVGSQLEVVKAYTRDQFTFTFPSEKADEGKEYFLRYEVYDTDNGFVSSTYHDPAFRQGNDFMRGKAVSSDVLVDRFDDTDVVIRVTEPQAQKEKKAAGDYSIIEDLTGIGSAVFSVLPRLTAGCGHHWNGIEGNLAIQGKPEVRYKVEAALVDDSGTVVKNWDGREVLKNDTVTTSSKGTYKWRYFLNASLPEEAQDKALHIRYTVKPADGKGSAVTYDNTDDTMYVRPYQARGKNNALIVTEGSGITSDTQALTAGQETVIENTVVWEGLAGDTEYTITTDLMDGETNTAIEGCSQTDTFKTDRNGGASGSTDISYKVTPDASLAGKNVYLRYRIDGGTESNLPGAEGASSSVKVSADTVRANPPAGIHISSGIAPIDGKVLVVEADPKVSGTAGDSSSVSTGGESASENAQPSESAKPSESPAPEQSEAPKDENASSAVGSDDGSSEETGSPEASGTEDPKQESATGDKSSTVQTETSAIDEDTKFLLSEILKDTSDDVSVQCWSAKLRKGGLINLVVTMPENGITTDMELEGLATSLSKDALASHAEIEGYLGDVTPEGKSCTVLTFVITADAGEEISLKLKNIEASGADEAAEPIEDVVWTATVRG